jgi:small subunit ribosomal protein S29
MKQTTTTRTAAPKRGQKTTFTKKKKKGHGKDKGRPPAPGERRAMRKRIILSNTNALEVEGMADLTAVNSIDDALQGQVIGIPAIIVDSLRAIEAFKVCQPWGLFRRPAMLMRRESIEMARLLKRIEDENKIVRRVLVGDKGSGKSLLQLQAMALAFLNKWVVINIPEGIRIP